MRLAILDSGHGFGTKALFSLIATVSRQPVLDIIKLVRYRADFFGKPMGAVTHEALRGESAWSIAEAFHFVVPGEDAINAGAKFLLARGYR